MKISRRKALRLATFIGTIWLTSNDTIFAEEEKTNINIKRKKALVIGAGMAGITAAKKLLENNFDVTVIEARERPGGRILTSNIGNISVDMGAAWIHGDSPSNPLMELVEKYKLVTAPTNWDETWFYTERGNIIEDRDFNSIERITNKIIIKIHKLQINATSDQSMESIIEDLFEGIRAPSIVKNGVKWWLSSEIEAVSAANYKDLSLQYWDEDEAYEGDDLLLLEGYGNLIKKMTEGINIEYNKRVDEIEYGKTEVIISGEWGRMSGDIAIVTVPLGVLKNKSIDFVPKLPEEKIDSIERLEMGLLNKIVIQFDKRFWPSKAHRLGLISESTNERIEFFPARPASDNAVLIALTYGDYARSLERRSKEEILHIMLSQIKKLFPRVSKSNIVDILVTKWDSDEFTYGSYSYIPPNASLDDCETLSKPVENNLLFAGEATNRYYLGTVHGAYISGLRAASQALLMNN